MRMPRDGEIIFAKVDQHDSDFATIIAVDGAGCVRHGHPMFQGEAGTGPHLHLEPRRDGDRDAGLDGRAPTRGKHDIGLDSRLYIHTGGACRGI